jgi:dolichol-phosphate mannosyltransferase
MIMNIHELALVMPVYNEDACIEAVIDAWYAELSRLGIDFRMIVLNDGSRDNTEARLSHFAGNEQIQVINKENSGHGRTILQGYRLAVAQAEWVFQVDSDDEMGAAHFEGLWKAREGYAALFGFRSGRQQNVGRKLISSISRLAVEMLFGRGIVDVNTPFRLIRSRLLKEIVAMIPVNTFAPNILISGVLAASNQPLLNIPVPHEGRKTGQVSIVKWRLWKAAACSLMQTAVFRIKYFRVVK